MFLHVDSADSDQTGQMPRMIRVFAGCTSFCCAAAHILLYLGGCCVLDWGYLLFADACASTIFSDSLDL